MAENITQNINLIFYYVCLISAISLAFWCLSEYSKNEEFTETSFHVFDSDKQGSQYPSMTMCTKNSYNDIAFHEYNDSNINSTSYSEFLRGKHWNKNMLSVDYDFVTSNVEDYIIGACIFTSRSKSECQKFGNIKHFTRVGFLGVMKCFSFNHKSTGPIDEVYIAINNSIHPNGLRKAIGQFFIMFHYPDQITRGLSNLRYTWPLKTNQMRDYYSMTFKISNVEILKRRKNGKGPCYYWQDYDLTTVEDVMDSVGCRPPYWKSRRDHQPCKSQKQLESVEPHFFAKSMQDDKFQKYIPPCIEITKMDVVFKETLGIVAKNTAGYGSVFDRFIRNAGTTKDWFVINTQFWKSASYKEMRKVKAYSLQSMVGNAGGYIGLLVGISISDLPCFLFKSFLALKRKW